MQYEKEYLVHANMMGNPQQRSLIYVECYRWAYTPLPFAMCRPIRLAKQIVSLLFYSYGHECRSAGRCICPNRSTFIPLLWLYMISISCCCCCRYHRPCSTSFIFFFLSFFQHRRWACGELVPEWV